MKNIHINCSRKMILLNFAKVNFSL